MGIPIQGSMTAFCQNVKVKGFTSMGRQDNVTLFKGLFTGRQATVAVGATDDGDGVHSVIVLFEESIEWRTLTSTYDYYKDLYIRKYGEPSFVKENNPSSSDSNTGLMGALHAGKVAWGSLWEITDGSIDLSIEKTSGFYEGWVMIRYRDAQNMEAKIQSDLNDI